MPLELTGDGLFLHLWRENTRGERVYPCVMTKGGHSGLQVTLTTRREDYHAVSLETLLGYLAAGKLDGVGRIQMKPRHGGTAHGFSIDSAGRSSELQEELRRRAVAFKAVDSKPHPDPTTPMPISFAEIVQELNRRATSHRIGFLQDIRRAVTGRRAPTRVLFDSRSTFPDYAYDFGGRTGLQFNVALEHLDGMTYLRHGVAFSLEPSQTLPRIEPLVPKVARFNEFFRVHPDEFADMMLWNYRNGIRSQNQPPAPIPDPWVRVNVFICLGKLQHVEEVDYDEILSDFDRLLPLYEFVEGSAAFPAVSTSEAGFRFRAGCRLKPTRTGKTQAERQLDVTLRHNELQSALYELLSSEYGPDSVGTEIPSGSAARVDVVLRLPETYWFYEIKTAGSARACIREALAQLLEYSYWPGAPGAERLVIVGEPELDSEAAAYIVFLRTQFGLPVDYQQILLASRSLGEEVNVA